MTEPVLHRPRRIVTGHDAEGRSIFIQDGPAPNLIQPQASPNVGMFNLWTMAQVPASSAGNDEAAPADARITLAPTLGGINFRVMEFPPDAERNWAGKKSVFEQYGNPEALTPASDRHRAYRSRRRGFHHRPWASDVRNPLHCPEHTARSDRTATCRNSRTNGTSALS